MVDATILTSRLTRARRAIAANTRQLTSSQRNRLQRITADIDHLLESKKIPVACQRLADHQAGYPSASGSGSNSGPSDPTSIRALGHRDPVDRDIDTIDQASRRLDANIIQLLRPDEEDIGTLLRVAEGDAKTIRAKILWWARPPDVRWCRNCESQYGGTERVAVARGRYRDLCRTCGDWKAVNKVLPTRVVLDYYRRGEPIPDAVLARYHARVPNGKKVRRRKR